MEETMLGRLARLSQTHRLPRGNLLFQQGEEGDALYGVAEGLIRIWVSGDGGKELTLQLLEPGDVFGEIALLDGLPRSASAEAVDDRSEEHTSELQSLLRSSYAVFCLQKNNHK